MAKVFVHIANEDCLDDIVVTSIECDFKPTKGDIIYNCQAELSKIANENKIYPEWKYEKFTYDNEIDFSDAVFVKNSYFILNKENKMEYHIDLTDDIE